MENPTEGQQYTPEMSSSSPFALTTLNSVQEASAQMIHSTSTVTDENKQHTPADESEICGWCQHAIEDAARLIPCGHELCSRCVRIWLLKTGEEQGWKAWEIPSLPTDHEMEHGMPSLENGEGGNRIPEFRCMFCKAAITHWHRNLEHPDGPWKQRIYLMMPEMPFELETNRKIDITTINPYMSARGLHLVHETERLRGLPHAKLEYEMELFRTAIIEAPVPGRYAKLTYSMALAAHRTGVFSYTKLAKELSITEYHPGEGGAEKVLSSQPVDKLNYDKARDLINSVLESQGVDKLGNDDEVAKASGSGVHIYCTERGLEWVDLYKETYLQGTKADIAGEENEMAVFEGFTLSEKGPANKDDDPMITTSEEEDIEKEKEGLLEISKGIGQIQGALEWFHKRHPEREQILDRASTNLLEKMSEFPGCGTCGQLHRYNDCLLQLATS